LLDAARAGDAKAFEQLVAPYRGELVAHCYRMLGSLHDAEDAVQETLLRAWRGAGTLDDRGFVRAWLYRIATNRCLTALERRARRELPVDLSPGMPAAEVRWLEPFPGTAQAASPETHVLEQEHVELAFVAALQHLPSIQRAALILRDVVGFSAAEVAELLATSTASVNSALQRARKAVPTGTSQREALGALGHEGAGRVVRRWTRAWEAGDIDAIVAMLADDARYSMPPVPEWYRGLDEIRAFLLRGPLLYRWRLLPVMANGQLAFGTYMWDDERRRYLPGGLDVLTLHDGRVAEVTAFLQADFARFGLPPTLTD
jgi:RNA polymerase sigma-70 factor (ECF subfamily)